MALRKQAAKSPPKKAATDPIVELAEKLRRRGETLGFAESCTGGLVSARVAALAGVSDVYHGSIVAYANDVKTSLLKVPESLLRQVGAVSTPVAEAMARGAKSRLAAHWSGSITGIAGPSGGTPQKPVGTVCFAVSGPGVEWSTMLRFDGDRAAIQDQSAQFIIAALNAALTDGAEELERQFGPRTGL